MHKTWLIFSQAVTVALAVLFVVATLKPDWVGRRTQWLPVPTVIQAPPGAPTAASGAGGLSVAPAARVAMPAVVSVSAVRPANPHGPDGTVPLPGHSGAGGEGLGSAVIVSPEGYLLTNHHVVAGATDIEVRLPDGRETRARLVGTDAETDIAVLKIDLSPLPVITLGDPAALLVGDPVLAIGNPFNVGQTVTFGIVSALGRNRLGLSTYENFIQTDAAINPGNSGGALVDVRGALVGINTAILSESEGNQGVGFAVSIDLAREVMAALVRDGRVVRGWIGVEPRELTPDIVQALGLSVRQGVLIRSLLQDGPAQRAGLRPGDVVVAVDGQSVRTEAELLRLVARLAPKSRAVLGVQRGGQRLDLAVVVGQRPESSRR